MSRKDYIKFANMLASHSADVPVESDDWKKGYEAARQDIGRSLAAILRLDNERFDAARFFEAAGLTAAESESYLAYDGEHDDCDIEVPHTHPA